MVDEAESPKGLVEEEEGTQNRFVMQATTFVSGWISTMLSALFNAYIFVWCIHYLANKYAMFAETFNRVNDTTPFDAWLVFMCLSILRSYLFSIDHKVQVESD